MRLIVLLLAAAVLHADHLADNLPRTVAKLEAGQPITVVGFGDSITTYYGNRDRYGSLTALPELFYYGIFAQLVRQKYPRAPIHVVNAGVGGDTAWKAAQRLDRDVLAKEPDLVFTMFGANDSGSFSIAEYQANYRGILARLLAREGTEVVVVGTTPSLWDPAGLLTMNAAAADLAAEFHLPFVPGWEALSPLHATWRGGVPVADTEELFAWLGSLYPPDDMIHPNVQGHYLLGRYVWRCLTQGYRPQAPVTAALSRKLDLAGADTWVLTLTNTGKEPLTGNLRLLVSRGAAGPDAAAVEQRLPNALTGQALARPREAFALAPGETREIAWPAPAPDVSDARNWRWLEPGRATTLVNLFLPDGSCAQVGAVFAGEAAPLTVTFPGHELDRSCVAAARMPLAVTATAGPVLIDWQGRHAVFVGRRDTPFSVVVAANRAVGDATQLAVATHDGDIEAHLDLRPVTDLDTRLLEIHGLAADGTPTTVWRRALQVTPVVDVTAPRDYAIGTAGSFQVSRAGDALVFTWRVLDDKLVPLDKGWHSDGVELYLEAAGQTVQYGAFIGTTAGTARVANGHGATADGAARITAAWQPTDTGWSLTATVPLDLLPAGPDIRFSTAVNDLDTTEVPTRNRVQTQWAGDHANYWRPDRYGLLRREPGPPAWTVNLYP